MKQIPAFNKHLVMLVGFRTVAGLRKETRVTHRMNFPQTFWLDRILKLLCCHLRFISVSCQQAQMLTQKCDRGNISLLPWKDNFTCSVFPNYNLYHQGVI